MNQLNYTYDQVRDFCKSLFETKEQTKRRHRDESLKKLKKECDRQYELTGKQHFVIPVNTRGVLSYSLMNNELHKQYNKTAKKMGLAKISYPELLKMAVYRTGKGKL
jgi:hypothetical protein